MGLADCDDIFQSWSSSWADIRSPLSHLSSTVSCEMFPTTAFKVVICDTTAATSPHRLTLFIELFHAANFSPTTVCGQVPFTFPATAVMLGVSILLLSTVDPHCTGGHRDPNRGTLPGETGHQSVTVDFPFLFPLLSFSYFISLSL